MARGGEDFLLFCRRDACRCAAKIAGAAQPHFNKHQRRAVFADKIDFPMPAAKISFDDFQLMPNKVIGCQVFCRGTRFLRRFRAENAHAASAAPNN